MEFANIYPMDAVFDTPDDVPQDVRPPPGGGIYSAPAARWGGLPWRPTGGCAAGGPSSAGGVYASVVARAQCCTVLRHYRAPHLWERQQRALISFFFPARVLSCPQVKENKRYAGNEGWTVSECAAKASRQGRAVHAGLSTSSAGQWWPRAMAKPHRVQHAARLPLLHKAGSTCSLAAGSAAMPAGDG